MKKKNMALKTEKTKKTEKVNKAKIKKIAKAETEKTVEIEKTAEAGKTTKKPKKEKKIANSLMVVFAGAIVLITLLGMLSYQMASKAVMHKYEDAVISTASSTSTSIQLICESISNKAVEFYLSEDFNTYYNDMFQAGGTEATRYANGLNDDLIAMKSAASYIGNYYVYAQGGKSLLANVKGFPEGAYQAFMETAEGQALDSKKTSNAWKGNHEYIDQALGMNNDAYAFSFMMHFVFKNNKGFLVIDVDKNYMEKLLEVMELGDGSIRGIVTEDGREFLLQEEKKSENNEIKMTRRQDGLLFADKAFFQEASSKDVVSEYIQVDGKSQLFVSAPVGKTGMKVCVLVPKNTILAEVSGIRNITIIIVILASLLAVICGFWLSKGISNALKSMSSSLYHISQGNLMERVEVKRKDEFGTLAGSINEMLGGIKGLVGNNQKFGSQVKELSEEAFSFTTGIEDSMRQVASSMESVSGSVKEQSRQTELSVEEMADFSEKINDVYRASEEMTQKIEEALHCVEQGKDGIDELSVKSKETAEIAESLVSSIDQVNIQSARIVDIITTIEDIASQTNLLSLNASIEAARAGESGKGFSVVATEIRKLADQSMEAGTVVREIVSGIQESNQLATDAAKMTEDFLHGQTDMLKDTVSTFGVISGSVTTLVEVLGSIREKMKNMQENKDVVNQSIDEIFQLSAQIALSIENVSDVVQEKLKEVNTLADTVRLLNTEAEELQESMSRFVLEESLS
ncbi:MAG: methyl-accepting chemotaxis protein [Lachnospiraceae bacterium]|nr:methyl-accepting chemotaxis protein [Lachnospiraceae bacterium]